MTKEELKLIGVRVSVDAWTTLRAVMVIEDADSLQELLRPVLEGHAKTAGRRPAVKKVVEEIQREREGPTYRRGKRSAGRPSA